MTTEKPTSYRHSQVSVTREQGKYTLSAKLSNDSPNSTITVITTLRDEKMLDYYDLLTSVISSRADELRELSGRYDQALGLIKKVRGAK